MANKYLKAVIFLAFIFVVNNMFAGGPPPPRPNPVPIDGGIIGLFVVAMGFAARKIYNSKK